MRQFYQIRWVVVLASIVRKVYVPSDDLMVGASRCIVIDRETGDILADSKFGE